MGLPVLHLPDKLKEYSGIIYFVCALLISNYVWKFTVIGSETDLLVTFFDANISAPFVYLAKQVAHISLKVLHLFGSHAVMEPGNTIRNENGYAVRVIWSCAGIKQAYIFFCIIIFYRGHWLKKLWFIPSGILFIHLFNILRVSTIIGIVQHRPEWFDILHEGVFKYLFYGFIFGMWVLWEEKLTKEEPVKKE